MIFLCGLRLLVVILVVLTETTSSFSLLISHLLAKAIPVRGANLKKADVHRRLLFCFLSISYPPLQVLPRSPKNATAHDFCW
ncbi:hypothetical protein ACS25C_16980 [Dickeya undicola]|uniref:hypothetical protein n=1 Tax=Dickeya undicola TaxID=1577887 RepID=UPI003F28A8C0